MTYQETDTIIALSSGQGRAGIAVIRLSGPKSDDVLYHLTRKRLPETRKSATRWILSETGDKLDESLILRFKAPASFSGEDMAEIHCHGSPAIVEEILSLATSIGGVRHAQRGEFSQRAFENGKIDLLQAEGIADLIDADSSAQLKQAARFVAGDASGKISEWRQSILEASAFLAASIDFSDEGDVSDEVHAPAIGILDGLISEFGLALEHAKSASRVRDGIRIAVLGKPNAGKSTLINALSGRDAAIVSEIAGTTRDILESHLIIAGVPVTIADTAGLRETDDPIEAEGVKRARSWSENADLRLYLSRADEGELTRPSILADQDIWIISQIDRVESFKSDFGEDIALSMETGLGFDELKTSLEAVVMKLTQSSEAPIVVRLRHIESLTTGLDALMRAKSQLIEFGDVDLSAFELSIARSALDRILGHVDVEDILGEVFSGFCVGK